MQFFIFVLLLCFVVFLYKLYHLSNDDFVLIRKNVSPEQIFNAAIVCSFLSLFFSRLFHVVANPKTVFLNPLGFLVFPYFPGLSLLGGVLGGVISLFIFAKFKKIPLGRAFDFFSISFLTALPVGFIGYFLLSKDITTGRILEFVVYIAILFVLTLYLHPRSSSLSIKDGTIAILFLMFFSVISLLGNSIDHPGKTNFLANKENYILLGMLFSSIGLLIKNEITGRMSFGDVK